MVPRVLVEGCGDDLLSGVGQNLHRAAQRLEVGVAPELHTLGAGYGRRVLPQVEVVAPLRRGRKQVVLHLQLEGQAYLAAAVTARDGYLRAVDAGRGVGRNVDRDPYRTRRARRHVEAVERVEHVGLQYGRVVLRAGAYTLGVALVGDGVAYESRRGDLGGEGCTVGGEVVGRAHDALGARGAPQNCLCRYALTAPRRQTYALRGILRGGGYRTAVEAVGAAPHGVEALADAIPRRRVGGNGVVGLGEGLDGGGAAAATRGHKCHGGDSRC